jgi:hypothetical protein
MKLARSMKIVGLFVALLAVLTLAVPSYAWEHDGQYRRVHYTGYYYNHEGYGHWHRHYWDHDYEGYGHWHRHHWDHYRYSGYDYPYYRPYRSQPSISVGLPGFSVYIGP